MMAAGCFTEPERPQYELPGIAGGRLNVSANSNIQAVWKLNEIELRHNIEGEASWHWQYRNSSYIYIGGLDVRLTEGDIIVVFSQWGEPVDIHLVRDKRTGVPKGFAFLAYEDQRSTILAVDNANGMQLLQHTLRVDHCKHYRPPERQKLQEGQPKGDSETTYEATGAEGKGLGVYGVTRDQQKRLAAEKQAQRLLQQNRLQENQRAAALQRQGIKDVDEMWCEEFEEMLQQINKEAEAEAEQQLEAEAAQRKQRQKQIEKQAKKEWKREWRQQRAAQMKKKEKKKEGHSDIGSSDDSRERVKKKEKKKKKHRRAGREEDNDQDTHGDGYHKFEGKKEERVDGGCERREPRAKEYDGISSRKHR